MTARLLSRTYEAALRPLGLKLPQFGILGRHRPWSDDGRQSETVLAERLGLERTTLVRNLKLLDPERLDRAYSGRWPRSAAQADPIRASHSGSRHSALAAGAGPARGEAQRHGCRGGASSDARPAEGDLSFIRDSLTSERFSIPRLEDKTVATSPFRAYCVYAQMEIAMLERVHGIVSRDVLTAEPGLAFLRGMLEGRHPAPPSRARPMST